MRSVAVLVLVALIGSACEPGGPSRAEPSELDRAEMMASALTELVTRDHTFGTGPPPFTEYLIEVNTVPIDLGSGLEEEASSDATRPLTAAERAAIETAISKIGPVRWVEDPDDWRTADLEPEIEGSVILGVDTPVLDDGGALVPVSLWCGGDCGTWFTYRLERVAGSWVVTGKEGTVAIS